MSCMVLVAHGCTWDQAPRPMFKRERADVEHGKPCRVKVATLKQASGLDHGARQHQDHSMFCV